jgi:CheY-like chemotaxis protein
MTGLKNLSPTVLLVDELGNDCCLMKFWLEKNGYNVREVVDVCDALMEMTDMTQAQLPAMILLNSYTSLQESDWVIESLQQAAQGHDIPIVALSAQSSKGKKGEDEYFVQFENFDSLKPLMHTLLPVYSQTRAMAA